MEVLRDDTARGEQPRLVLRITEFCIVYKYECGEKLMSNHTNALSLDLT